MDMEYLFGNDAYPIVTSEADIVEAYDTPLTRAVILRDEETWQKEAEIFRSGIIMRDENNVGGFYVSEANSKNGRRVAGEVSYLDVISASEILAEAAKAEIVVSAEACEVFHNKMNYMRELYNRVHDEYYGAREDETVVGHAMFTPKGGIGRATMMHVDDVNMTLHSTFAGATLRLLDGITTERLWDLMDKTKLNSMDQSQRDSSEKELSSLTESYGEEFGNAYAGDLIFMKGQKGKDLKDPEVRKNMAVHASSSYIPYQGQAASIFYSKKTLDIE